MIWSQVTVAGRSNALSGVAAANSKYPVSVCPPFSDKDDMMVNILILGTTMSIVYL